MLRLYNYPLSPYCHRVRIVLAEKGLDYEIVQVDLANNEQHSEIFLRLNPLGKVPVLVDEDLVIAESLVINEYLNEEYPFPELMPQDNQARATARLWMSRIDTMISQSFSTLYRASVAEQAKEIFELSRLDQAKNLIQQFLELADRTLKNHEYLADTYSLADIAFAPWVSRFQKYEIQVPANLTYVSSWMKKLGGRKSVAGTV